MRRQGITEVTQPGDQESPPFKGTTMLSRPAFGCAVALLLVTAEFRVAPAQAEPTFTRQADVIYGRKYGTALTMDAFTPKKNANGAAAILVISGGWSSARDFPPQSAFAGGLLQPGSTVFAAYPSTPPPHTSPELTPALHP